MKLVRRLKAALSGKKWRVNRSRLVISAIVGGVLLLVILGAWWYFAKPLSRGVDVDGGEVGITEPDPGTVITPGTTLSGDYSGEGQVHIWVKGINYAVEVESEDGLWEYEYLGGIDGTATIMLSLVKDNKFGPPTEATYHFSATGVAGERPYVTENWPAAQVFKPIEKAVRATATAITEVVEGVKDWVTGDGSGDLDGDEVPDQWQGSQFPPTSKAGGLPYTNTLLAITVIMAIMATAYIVRPEPIANAIAAAQRASVSKAVARAKSEAIQAKATAELQDKKLKVIADLKGAQIKEQARYAKQQLAVKGKLLGKQLDAQKELVKRGG